MHEIIDTCLGWIAAAEALAVLVLTGVLFLGRMA